MTDILEAEVRELDPLPPDRAIVKAQPGQAIVASATDPAAMVAVATRLADVLADIVERKKLYANISGRRYPTVEAWATIARLDNVVAREGQAPVRNEDGSWEAHAELIRLSDGMVIGSSSALCGDPADRPWNTRADYQKRSMAQTRATSRAFRQQYSWIMALAGYEPTPAEEMPREDAKAEQHDDNSLIGIAHKEAKLTTDFLLRESPEGWFLGFRIKEGRGTGVICEARDALAMTLAAHAGEIIGQRVQVWGAFVQYGPPKVQHPYRAFRVERLTAGTLDFTADASTSASPDGGPPPSEPGSAVSEPSAPDVSSASGSDDAAVNPDSGGSVISVEPSANKGSAPTDPATKEASASGSAAKAEASTGNGASADLCGVVSPYGDDETCDLLRGHNGVHKRVSAPIPMSWTAP